MFAEALLQLTHLSFDDLPFLQIGKVTNRVKEQLGQLKMPFNSFGKFIHLFDKLRIEKGLLNVSFIKFAKLLVSSLSPLSPLSTLSSFNKE